MEALVKSRERVYPGILKPLKNCFIILVVVVTTGILGGAFHFFSKKTFTSRLLEVRDLIKILQISATAKCCGLQSSPVMSRVFAFTKN